MRGDRTKSAMRRTIEDLNDQQRITEETARDVLDLLESEGFNAALQRLLSPRPN